MNVIWVHNFNPSHPVAGNFMYLQAQGLRKNGLNIKILYLGNIKTPLGIINAIKLVKKIPNEYDIIHSQYGSICSFITTFSRIQNKVVTLRGSDWYLYRSTNLFKYFHSLLATFATKISLNKFQLIITVSNRMKREIIKDNPQYSVEVLPSPIDLDKFKPKFKNEFDWDLNSSKIILLITIDKKNPQKGISLAEDAIALVRLSLPNVELKIISGYMHSEIPELIRESSLVLCLSKYEGWPNAIKEALACNVPFVATDVSDLNEICCDNPLCYIAKPTPKDISEKILKSLTFLPRSTNKLRKYVEHMDVDISSKILLQKYRKLFLDKYK